MITHVGVTQKIGRPDVSLKLAQRLQRFKEPFRGLPMASAIMEIRVQGAPSTAHSYTDFHPTDRRSRYPSFRKRPPRSSALGHICVRLRRSSTNVGARLASRTLEAQATFEDISPTKVRTQLCAGDNPLPLTANMSKQRCPIQAACKVF